MMKDESQLAVDIKLTFMHHVGEERTLSAELNKYLSSASFVEFLKAQPFRNEIFL